MTEDQILKYLDQCDYPFFGNGYYYHIDQKLTLFQDESRWAIIIQILVDNNHELCINGVKTIVYTYGNFLDSNKIFDNESFFNMAKDHKTETFIEEKGTFNSYLNPSAQFIKVKNELVPIEHSHEKYKIKAINLKEEDKVRPWELLRYLCPEYSNLFWVTQNELSNKIPMELPEKITLSDWEHPDDFNTESSDMNSFRKLAQAIASKEYKYLKVLKKKTLMPIGLIGLREALFK